MGSLGMPELLLIALVFIIIFGGGKLPQLGRGLGEGIRNFRDAMREGERGSDEKRESEPPPAEAGTEKAAETKTQDVGKV
ncbi:MAG TPA: twin-arginine translocase TatA/TatE family subunit [Vicinamibacteria bacterium]|nr:twin-arginine translocase TatA/TatE family subunit [Vicinamibacteria bacterium]